MGTISIPLNKGKFALIDEVDFDLVRSYRWYFRESHQGRGYAESTTGGGMHRLIMAAPKGMQVDHINGDGLDNRRENLRLCTHAQNCQNRRPISKASPYKGVSISRKKNKKWQASIYANGKTIWLGRFHTPVEAARAYDEAARRYQGEFAWLNFPDEGGVDNVS